MQIRKATIEDAAGIAKVGVDTWRNAYCGIISDEYLDGLNYERSTRLALDGHCKMLLWVLSDNHSSRAFYERTDGCRIGTKMLEIGGQKLEVTSYGWDI
ncbi:MAG: hypothetical protein NT018_07660 [Armatimonadetes bacterium]|nr:hypothetical protein [Armatimonadota bacterium]